MWPADFGTHREWDSIYYSAYRRENAQARVRSRAADRVLCQRFSRLIGYLTSGELIATGITRDGRSAVEVPRSIWERTLAYLDLENGDLVEYLRDGRSDEEYSPPIFMGLMLRRGRSSGPLFHGEPLTLDTVPSTTLLPDTAPRKKSLAKAEGHRAAESACVEWLAEIMRASPAVRLESKEALWSKAQTQWPRLSERAFERAKAEAVRLTGAVAWAASGAPPKKATRNNRRT
jgi:hypothetical protein